MKSYVPERSSYSEYKWVFNEHSVKSLLNKELFQFSMQLCHPHCGSQDPMQIRLQDKGSGAPHYTKTGNALKNWASQQPPKKESNTLYQITELASCWKTLHLTADLRKTQLVTLVNQRQDTWSIRRSNKLPLRRAP